MALRKNHHIPGKSERAHCRFETGEGNRCDEEATTWVAGQVEVLGKKLNIKLPVCDEHIELLTERQKGMA